MICHVTWRYISWQVLTAEGLGQGGEHTGHVVRVRGRVFQDGIHGIVVIHRYHALWVVHSSGHLVRVEHRLGASMQHRLGPSVEHRLGPSVEHRLGGRVQHNMAIRAGSPGEVKWVLFWIGENGSCGFGALL